MNNMIAPCDQMNNMKHFMVNRYIANSCESIKLILRSQVRAYNNKKQEEQMLARKNSLPIKDPRQIQKQNALQAQNTTAYTPSLALSPHKFSLGQENYHHFIQYPPQQNPTTQSNYYQIQLLNNQPPPSSRMFNKGLSRIQQQEQSRIWTQTNGYGESIRPVKLASRNRQTQFNENNDVANYCNSVKGSKVQTQSQMATKSEIMRRKKAIALEVLVKFDNKTRECQPIMPFDIKTDKTKQILCSLRNKKVKPFSGFQTLQTHSKAVEHQSKLIEKTLQAIKNEKCSHLEQILTKVEEDPEQLPSIKKLELVETSLSKIIDLSLFSKLEEVTIGNNGLQQIGDLGILPSLKKLDLSKNKIVVITHLSKFIRLQELYLNDNLIQKIQGLTTLTKLTTLNLSKNRIEDIENIQNLTQLKILTLMGNKITTIINLDNLTSLQNIDLSFNMITKIQNLSNLFKIKVLNLRANNITVIENVYMLKNASTLDIALNKVNKKKNIFALQALRDRKVQVIFQ